MFPLNRINRFRSNLKFRYFEHKVHSKTWSHHAVVSSWARKMLEKESQPNLISGVASEDLFFRGKQLTAKVCTEFKDKYISTGLRILIHLPPNEWSPGGHSLFLNIGESLQYLGAKVEYINFYERIEEKIQNFQPNIFLSSDHDSYKAKVNWEFIKAYKSSKFLRIGLTASIEAYGNTPLLGRLSWAKDIGIDFYYSFRAPQYLTGRECYKPFYDYGYNIFSIEFGANPLQFFPVLVGKKDISFSFLASSNPDKHARYFAWLPEIINRYPGFIDGPGWHHIKSIAPRQIHRFLYARSKVGLNLHIDDSIDWACELNERTYILAACGIPQLIDNPKLISERFSAESMYLATSPSEYCELFHHILENEEEAQQKSKIALEEVFAKHTTFHRAAAFIENLIQKFEVHNGKEKAF